MPAVSVIVPNYNHARFLRQRVDSILGQTYQDFELILLDDCSTDESQAILLEYSQNPRVRIEFNEANSGSAYKQWNKGVRLARGKYIWVAESDDYADRRLLERLSAILDNEPKVVFVYCRSWRVGEDGREDGFGDYYLADLGPEHWASDYRAEGRILCAEYFVRRNIVPNASAVLFRKVAYERVGGADESFQMCGDWKAWASMALIGDVAYISEPLSFFRVYEGSIWGKGRKHGLAAEETLKVVRWMTERVVPTERASRVMFEGLADALWIPAVASRQTPAAQKWRIARNALAVDPKAWGRLISGIAVAVRLKAFSIARVGVTRTRANRMKKIAFIATNEWVPWGGSEYCWAAAAEKLADRGVNVRVSLKNWGSPVKQVEHLKSRGCRISYRFVPPPLRERVRTRLAGEGYEKRHLRAVGAGADLIVISQGGIHDGLSWMEAAREAGFRYAVISESANEQWWLGGDAGERLADCMEAAAAAYFVSEANLGLLRMQLARPLSGGRVIRNPFNVRYDAKPSLRGDPGDELRLACVARLDSAQKGQDLLIRVLGQAKWRARKVRVTLAGSGVHERVLHRTVERLKLASVEFAGFIEDMESFWGGHHALILPSRFEGMPLALVEAMLCGRAAIVTDVGGNTELVRDGVNGFVAKAPTVEFVDEAMERAWENRRRLREMGETAARDVRAWVGPDPTGDFVRELEALVDGAARARE